MWRVAPDTKGVRCFSNVGKVVGIRVRAATSYDKEVETPFDLIAICREYR